MWGNSDSREGILMCFASGFRAYSRGLGFRSFAFRVSGLRVWALWGSCMRL